MGRRSSSTILWLWLWLWVMLILVLEKGWCCLEEERIALLQLKASLNQSDDETSNCCQWRGVECNTTTNRVTKLTLSSMIWHYESLDWYFNASLFLPLDELTTLDLSRNALSKWVENEGFEGLSKLRNLEVLDLSFNSFNSSVLSSLSGLSSLKRLYLAWNDLKGSTHSKNFGRLTGLSNLEVLDLGGNQLNNSIHTFLKLDDLVSLKTLDLSGNHIKIFEPIQGLDGSSSSVLSNLEDLILSSNVLNNSIFPSLRGLSTLKSLDLSDNLLKASIHVKEFYALCNLEELDVSGNEIESFVNLEGWCELKNLQELDLSYNQFEGILPPCLGNLTYLRVFDISNNELTGNIASSPLSTLTSLEFLSLSYNHFQVPISFRSFANHSKLKVILCDNNMLVAENESNTWSPKFQLNFFSLSNLTNENFNAALPRFLHYQYDLILIDLSHNNLIGTFPNWLLENNTRLEFLYLNDNSLVGLLQLPSHPNPNISEINISNNTVGGRIPPNISSIFPNLQSLNMSGNAFDGSLTSLFQDMSALQILDLSNNL